MMLMQNTIMDWATATSINHNMSTANTEERLNVPYEDFMNK
jgi:hypothetical protein